MQVAVRADPSPGPRASELPGQHVSQDLAAPSELDGLEDLYRRHVIAVHGLARRLVGGSACSEITQAVFVTFWKQRTRISAGSVSIRALLLTITRHLAIEHLRTHGAAGPGDAAHEASPHASGENDSVGKHERIEGTDLASRISAALVSLSLTELLVVETARFGEITHREVALLLGLPEGVVRSRIRSGLRNIHAHLVLTSRTAARTRSSSSRT